MKILMKEENPTQDNTNESLNPSHDSDKYPESDDGLELESEDSVSITNPFDPEQIKIRTERPTILLIVARVEHNEIDLVPEFQRAAGIWDPKRQSRLIESLLLRIPIPAFYVAERDSGKWLIVDGVLRISTINDFVQNEFSLSQLEYFSKFNTCKYDDLPRTMQRRIQETSLIVNVIEQGTPDDVMFNIFSRINTGGMSLNGQEIRHALNPGPVREYLRSLAISEEFLSATAKSIKPKRMADRECILRFAAFFLFDWKNYINNDLDRFLFQAMKSINKMNSQEKESLTCAFMRSMRTSKIIFGERAFRKIYERSEDYRRPINKALFETWSVGLARRSSDQNDTLAEKREDILDKFAETLATNSEFDNAISVSTGDPRRVHIRFQTIDELIQDFL